MTSKQQLPEIVLSQTELAAGLGLTDRWLRELTTQKVITRNAQGKYSLWPTIRALMDRAKGDQEKLIVSEERARLLRAQAELRELELAQRSAKLLDAQDVEAVWAKHVTTVRAKFLALPSRLAAEISGMDDPAKCQRLIQDAIYEALTELGSEG